MWVRAVHVLSATLLVGCGTDLAPETHIEATEIFMIRHEVEPGYLYPDRGGPEIAGPQMPFAEALPGDLARLVAVVVDVDGRVLAEDEIDTLWIQCGARPCDDPYQSYPLDSAIYDTPCDEMPLHDVASTCKLGTGAGSFEFTVPPLASWPGYLVGYDASGDATGPRLYFYAIVAWDGKSAEDCWDSRRGDRANLDRCSFIRHHVSLGPIWWLYAYAASLGLEPPLDPAAFPELLLSQPANRVPRPPTLRIELDGELVVEAIPPLDPIPVDVGARVRVGLTFDPLSQLFQSTFEPLPGEVSNAFVLMPERLHSFTATSGAMRTAGPSDVLLSPDNFAYDVVADAPNESRVLLGYRDEGGGRGYVSVEFEPR